jgi:DNA-binding NarL/FixJ family response regulator
VQVKISIPAFAAILLIVFFATLYMANADSYLSSPVQSHRNQDAIKTTITDGLRLANDTSQRWQENQSDQQEQPLTANVLNSRNHQFDNPSPSVISGLPY